MKIAPMPWGFNKLVLTKLVGGKQNRSPIRCYLLLVGVDKNLIF